MAYSWETKYYRLTKDQRARGVIFSSQLVVLGKPDMSNQIHEVMHADKDKREKIDNLKDVRFFKRMAHDFGYRVVEIRRS